MTEKGGEQEMGRKIGREEGRKEGRKRDSVQLSTTKLVREMK